MVGCVDAGARTVGTCAFGVWGGGSFPGPPGCLAMSISVFPRRRICDKKDWRRRRFAWFQEMRSIVARHLPVARVNIIRASDAGSMADEGRRHWRAGAGESKILRRHGVCANGRRTLPAQRTSKMVHLRPCLHLKMALVWQGTDGKTLACSRATRPFYLNFITRGNSCQEKSTAPSSTLTTPGTQATFAPAANMPARWRMAMGTRRRSNICGKYVRRIPNH